MAKKKFQKSIAERIHAERRFIQRFGELLTEEDYNAIRNRIYKGKYEFIGKQSNRVSIFKGEIKGFNVLIVYDKIRKQIATFIPADISQCCPYLNTDNLYNNHKEFVCLKNEFIVANSKVIDCCMFCWWRNCEHLKDLYIKPDEEE